MTLDTADTFQPRDSSNSTLVSMNSPIPEPITRDWLSFAIPVIFTRHLRSPKDHKPSKPGSVISFKALHPSPNSFFLLPLLLFFFSYNDTILRSTYSMETELTPVMLRGQYLIKRRVKWLEGRWGLLFYKAFARISLVIAFLPCWTNRGGEREDCISDSLELFIGLMKSGTFYTGIIVLHDIPFSFSKETAS